MITAKPAQTKAPHVQMFCLETIKASGEIRTMYFWSQTSVQNCAILHPPSSAAFSLAKSCKIAGRWLCSIGSVALASKREKSFKTS